MRIFVAVLVALAVAAVLAAAIQYDSGYVLIAFGQTTVEMTVWVAVAVQALFVLLVLALFLALRRGSKFSSRLTTLRSTRRAQRDRNKTNRGLIAFIEGKWAEARKLLVDAARDSDQPLINYLLAARASHALGDEEGVRRYLGKAEGAAQRADVAVALNQADLQLESGQLESALATLNRVRSRADRYPAVLVLLYKVYRGLQDWTALRGILPELRKHELLDETQLEELERLALEGELRRLVQQRDPGGVAHWWKRLGSTWQVDRQLLLLTAQAYVELQDQAAAEKILAQGLDKHWHADWVALYGRVAGADVRKQLARAESWHRERGRDAGLLVALGRISLRNELWGKARDYFDAARQLESSAEVCFELARLAENMGDEAAARRFVVEALEKQSSALPALPQPSRSNPREGRAS